MKKITFVFIFLIMAYGLWLTAGFAQPVPSAEIIPNAKFYDGKRVIYEGEVIGEVMPRGDYVWVNANDGQNAIGIWLPKELVKDILYAGSYKARGDWIEVTGIFHRACAQHGGDLDIHADALKKTSAGRLIPHKLNREKMKLAFILLGILGIIWILSLFKRR